MTAKYVLGIDLGTTNCVLAYAALDSKPPLVELLKIPQLVAASTVESRAALPSFLYLAPEHEAASGASPCPGRVPGNSPSVNTLGGRGPTCRNEP